MTASAFNGAFTLLQGRSFHSTYAFDNSHRINAHLAFGDLSLCNVETLSPGDVREIRAGFQFIHSVFHMSMPSISVVVSSDRHGAMGPEHQFLPPSIAIDSTPMSALATRRHQTLMFLLRTKSESFDSLAHEFLRGADLHSSICFLRKAGIDLGLSPQLYGLVDTVRSRHGNYANAIVSCVEEEYRRNVIGSRRARITDLDLRFFLAVMLNCSNRESAMKAISFNYPSADPIDKVCSWIKQLNDPLLTGINFNDTTIELFGALLRGGTISAAISLLSQKYGSANVEPHEQSLGEGAAIIRESPALACLFR